MNLIRCSYKYRMYPNKTQEELLAKTFGCVRIVWNACVDSFNSYDKETNPNPKFPTKSDLVIEKPWLNEVSNIQAVGVDAAIRTQSSRVAGCVEASKME